MAEDNQIQLKIVKMNLESTVLMAQADGNGPLHIRTNRNVRIVVPYRETPEGIEIGAEGDSAIILDVMIDPSAHSVAAILQPLPFLGKQRPCMMELRRKDGAQWEVIAQDGVGSWSKSHALL